MLCRPYFARSGGYFAALVTPTLADALPPCVALLIGRLWRMLRRCGADYSSGCLGTHWLFSWSVGSLGDVVLHVASHVLGRVVGLGGLSGVPFSSVVVVSLACWLRMERRARTRHRVAERARR